jgi:hypothetical protein
MVYGEHLNRHLYAVGAIIESHVSHSFWYQGMLVHDPDCLYLYKSQVH